MGSKAFRIAKKQIKVDFFNERVLVEWNELFSETFMKYRSMPPEFVAVRRKPGRFIDA
jgi:hypothetical protein